MSGFYKCKPHNPLIPDTLYYSDINNRNVMIYDDRSFVDNVNFDTTDPIYSIRSNENAYIPLGNSNYYLNIKNVSGIVSARFYDIINKTESSSTYSIVDYTAVIDTYGFDIIGVIYVNASEFILIYNWKTSNTLRSITYFRGFIVTYDSSGAPSLTMTNADATFAASLAGETVSTSGTTIKGRLMISDANDNGVRLGLAYIRKTITAANVVSQGLVCDGIMAIYTTANQVSIAKTITTRYNINPSVSTNNHRGWFGDSDSHGCWQIVGTNNRYYYHQFRNHNVNTAGQAAATFRLSTTAAFDSNLNPNTAYNYELRQLGRLTNDTHVFIRRATENDWQLLIYEIGQNNASNACTINLVGEIHFNIFDNNINHAWLMKQNLFAVKSTDFRAAIYQIIKSSSGYRLEFLGSSNLLNYSANLVEDKLVPVIAPLGLYSNSGQSITSRLPLMNITYELSRKNVDSLSVARYSPAATTVGGYALFGGGYGSNYYSTVDAYDQSLTRSTPRALSVARSSLAATTVGNYALFGGGTASSTHSSTVDAYNESLTRSTPTGLSVARRALAATTVGGYALFGGGYTGSYSSKVDAYDQSLTLSTPTALSVSRRLLAATTVGGYALFGGGDPSSSTVDVYDELLTQSTPIGLSVARYSPAATTVGGYALFGGGYGGGYRTTVDAYDESLTGSMPTGLYSARAYLAATTVGGYALFGGGYGADYYFTVDAYDQSLTRSTPTALSVARSYLAATTVGNYALFGGGQVSSYYSTVDGYSVVQLGIYGG